MSMTDNLEAMLRRGQDSALLRYGLGSAYLKEHRPAQAVAHFAEAVRQDPNYSAAWKLYGKALTAAGEHRAAIDVLGKGIAAAEARGDLQAVKEMQVFRQRAEKRLDGAGRE